jgi:hypothetical protein
MHAHNTLVMPEQIGRRTYGSARARAGLTSIADKPHQNLREIERNASLAASGPLADERPVPHWRTNMVFDHLTGVRLIRPRGNPNWLAASRG